MKLHTIRLYGEMGSKFGRVHTLALDRGSVTEAVQALMSQIRGLRAYLTQAKDRGYGFSIFSGKNNLREEELNLPCSNDIRIAPILIASKSGGLFQVILGVVIIVASIAYGYYTGDWKDAGQGIAYGATMLAGGLIQMLTPLPRVPGHGTSQPNTPSYSFNGAVNTQAQGHPVPLFYGGPMPVGSAVISGGINVKDNDFTPTPAPAGSSFMGGGGGISGIARIRAQ